MFHLRRASSKISSSSNSLSLLLRSSTKRVSKHHQHHQHHHQAPFIIRNPLLSYNRQHSSTTSNNNYNKTGLFSLPNLHQPSDFLKLASNAITTCDDLRQQVRNSLPSTTENHTPLSPRETLFLLDDISNTVCSVIDASELCRSVHSSSEWRNAASNAFQILSEYIADLNADDALYQSLIPITSNSSIMNDILDEEERRMAILLQKEFERDGIHLSKEKRNEVQKLSGFVTQLETMFSENLLQNKTFDLDADLTKDVTQIIPRHVLIDATPQNQNQNGGITSMFDDDNSSITISTEPHIANTILRHSPSSQLRQKVFMESNTTCPQNLEVLDALIQQRHILSNAMGYESYAHYFTSDKMAGNPNQVVNFLKSISQACESRYKSDMGLILNAKKQIENCDDSEPLHAWDMNFYNGLIKSHMLLGDGDDDDGDDSNGSTSLSGYFTVDQSLDGMQILVQRLFGIVMKEVKTQPEEQWDNKQNDNPSSSTSKSTTAAAAGEESMIRKFEFYKEEDGLALGTIYFDLHPRQGKYTHAAHFTVRCGCESRNNTESSRNENQYQLPIVALVCNLSPPFSNAGLSSTTSILSHSEVETLFHEFGHALHSLLSRTKFQHLSGTRAAMDFVETPSHLMEYFVWNEEFLNIIGRHYVTGEAIPRKSIENLIKSRNIFKAIEVQTQVVYGLFDQVIFGSPDAWRGSGGSTTTTTDVFAELHRQYNVPYVEGTHWHSKFGHLVTYGAGYYSYLYASIFSADLWNTCFEGGAKAFSPEAGKSYWNEILIHGGAKDPNLMLRTMLGRDPKAEGFFKFS